MPSRMIHNGEGVRARASRCRTGAPVPHRYSFFLSRRGTAGPGSGHGPGNRHGQWPCTARRNNCDVCLLVGIHGSRQRQLRAAVNNHFAVVHPRFGAESAGLAPPHGLISHATAQPNRKPEKSSVAVFSSKFHYSSITSNFFVLYMEH